MGDARVPKYEKVADAIRKQITLGRHPVGTMLPPEPELEKLYGVSRATIRSAVQVLVREGIVSVKQGRGTMVLQPAGFRRFANVTSLSESVLLPCESDDAAIGCVLKIDQVRIQNSDDAGFLQVRLGDFVYRLQRLLKRGETPFCVHTCYLSGKLVPDFQKYEGDFIDLYLFLEQHYGIKYTRAVESVYAISAGIVESQLLDVPVDFPLLETRRTAFCDRGPMECSYQQIRSDLYSIKIHMSNE